MQHLIRLFEEFKQSTIDINNDVYNKRLNHPKRSSKVAWDAPGSQENNFEIVEKEINQNDTLLDYGCGIGDLIPYLEIENKEIAEYLGVDINPNYIDLAKEEYPDNNFQLIKNVEDISGKWDTICAIGVFTWFIEKEEFINTINTLYDKCNKQVLITCLLETDRKYKYYFEEETYWKEKYRYYSREMFKDMFPDFEFEFKTDFETMLVKIIKTGERKPKQNKIKDFLNNFKINESLLDNLKGPTEE
jgi:cyclopropane fatty-acyl-phospholipid synthase-like methyltransferase